MTSLEHKEITAIELKYLGKPYKENFHIESMSPNTLLMSGFKEREKLNFIIKIG